MSIDHFNAFILEKQDERLVSTIRTLSVADLPEGEVLIEVHYSSLNFKDSMAIANKGIIRKFPAVPGIDLAGVVVESSHPAYQPGAKVVATGWGIGERYWGGYSQFARVSADWLVPLPDGLTLFQAMQIGTAGFTAMMCVDALERLGVNPSQGPIAVTAASGGVGSVSLMLLAALGYEPWAVTRRASQTDYLLGLGAKKVVLQDDYLTPSKPSPSGRHVMEKESFAGAIDSVGGLLLSALIARISYGGSIAMCGLVGGAEFDTTVFPFILRGVSLLGIDSVNCPSKKRAGMWNRLAKELPMEAIASACRTIRLEEIGAVAADMQQGKAVGRVVVSLLDS